MLAGCPNRAWWQSFTSNLAQFLLRGTYGPDLSERITARTTPRVSMFRHSTLFLKPVLIGILPSLAIWACVIPLALKLK
jgi:hypothetical protein